MVYPRLKQKHALLDLHIRQFNLYASELKQSIKINYTIIHLWFKIVNEICICIIISEFQDDQLSFQLFGWSQGKSGPVFRYSYAMNIIVGQKQDGEAFSGLHTVADIYCSHYGQDLGWKYIKLMRQHINSRKEGS